MVEEIFAPRVKNDSFRRGRSVEIIEVKDPFEKFISDVKNAMKEYKSAENKEIKIGIFEDNRNIGFVN